MFGYRLVKIEKAEAEGNEAKANEKKSFDFKNAAKTAGKVLGTGLLVAGAFFVGKDFPQKKELPEADTDAELAELTKLEEESES